MYLHLGQSVLLPLGRLIGIFDLDNTSQSPTTNRYLTKAQKERRIITVTDDLPKSFVVAVDENDNTWVYISQLSSQTLAKRAESGFFETNLLPGGSSWTNEKTAWKTAQR